MVYRGSTQACFKMPSEILLRLAQLVQEKESVLSNKSKQHQTEQMKRDTWLSIMHAINSEFATTFTVSQIKDKYKYLKINAKRKHAENNKKHVKTGGGTANFTKISEAEEIVIASNRQKPSFSGLSCGIESEKENTLPVDDSMGSLMYLLQSNCQSNVDIMQEATTSTNVVPNEPVEKSCETVGSSSLKRKRLSVPELQRIVLEKQYDNLELQERVLRKAEQALDIFINHAPAL